MTTRASVTSSARCPTPTATRRCCTRRDYPELCVCPLSTRDWTQPLADDVLLIDELARAEAEGFLDRTFVVIVPPHADPPPPSPPSWTPSFIPVSPAVQEVAGRVCGSMKRGRAADDELPPPRRAARPAQPSASTLLLPSNPSSSSWSHHLLFFLRLRAVDSHMELGRRSTRGLAVHGGDWLEAVRGQRAGSGWRRGHPGLPLLLSPQQSEGGQRLSVRGSSGECVDAESVDLPIRPSNTSSPCGHPPSGPSHAHRGHHLPGRMGRRWPAEVKLRDGGFCMFTHTIPVSEENHNCHILAASPLDRRIDGGWWKTHRQRMVEEGYDGHLDQYVMSMDELKARSAPLGFRRPEGGLSHILALPCGWRENDENQH